MDKANQIGSSVNDGLSQAQRLERAVGLRYGVSRAEGHGVDEKRGTAGQETVSRANEVAGALVGAFVNVEDALDYAVGRNLRVVDLDTDQVLRGNLPESLAAQGEGATAPAARSSGDEALTSQDGTGSKDVEDNAQA